MSRRGASIGPCDAPEARQQRRRGRSEIAHMPWTFRRRPVPRGSPGEAAVVKVRWIRYALEELRMMRSLQDVDLLIDQKLPFFRSHLFGNPIVESDVPMCLQIEPTNHCDLKCVCCARDRSVRQKGFMDLDLFRGIVDDARDVGVRRVHLYLHGEPLMHPRIMDMIRYVKSKGIAISLTTNGMLLGRTKSVELLESGVNSADYVSFSMLGHSKEVHERLMEGVDHETVTCNLLELLRLRKEMRLNGPIIEAIFHAAEYNHHEAGAFSRAWRGVADHVHVFGISKQFAEFKRSGNERPVRSRSCTYLWQRLTVLWNGDVTQCMADVDGEHVMGNLSRESILDVWGCDSLQRLRERHRRGLFEGLSLCATCDW